MELVEEGQRQARTRGHEGVDGDRVALPVVGLGGTQDGGPVGGEGLVAVQAVVQLQALEGVGGAVPGGVIDAVLQDPVGVQAVAGSHQQGGLGHLGGGAEMQQAR